MNKKNNKKSHIRKKMQYLSHPTVNQLEAINECIRDTLALNIFITANESCRRQKICHEMNEIASEFGITVIQCGSLVTGLSMINSDVNLYIDLNTNKSNAISYLSQLEKLSIAFTEKLNLKTEIKLDKRNCGLFCLDSQDVLYHITSTTHMCQLTSELISVYIKIDSRAESLIKLFRYFARQSFIDRVVDGLFAPQVFYLLVIFYLQQLSIPILPNLHKLAETNTDLENHTVTTVLVHDTEVRYVSDIETIKRIWSPPQNSSNLAELWVGLLRFYSVGFDANIYMVSVRCIEPVLKIDRNIVNQRLAVDDPFDIKKNLLFSYNAPDVMDFFNDQLQGCYIYFAIPQLPSGPAFTKVNFIEMTVQSLPTMCLITPTFTRDDFTGCIDLLENEFNRLYTSESDSYDVSKWPVRLFVKLCLSSILTSILDSRLAIDIFVSLLDLKGSSYFAIGNFSQFKDHAINLSKCIFQNFSDYFEVTGSWTKPGINCMDAIDVINKAKNKFITDSRNKTLKYDANDDNNFDIEDCSIPIRKLNDVQNISTPISDRNKETKITNGNDLLNWKVPIAFKLINIPIKGILKSSNEPGVYNENIVRNITKEEMKYNFMNIPIHKQRLESICSVCGVRGHRKEFCKEAIPRFQELKNIIKDLPSEWLEILNTALKNKFKDTLPTAEHILKHEAIFTNIEKITSNLYPNSRLQMFGSYKSGFITNASDIDICLECFADNRIENLSNKDITIRLKNIGNHLEKSCHGINVSYAFRPNVPIIKFYSKDGIQGDISINNGLGIQNTKMIKLYTELYPDMIILGNLLKFVSKSCEKEGLPSRGTLSSYMYIIMLIHFLQKRGFLPVLQELYEGKVRPSVLIDNWDAWYQSNNEIIYKLWKPKVNDAQIEYLWLDFFYYYAVEFDIEREVISIKQSKPLYKIDKNWQMSYMAIEDPFDLHRNLSKSFTLDKCRYILQCFSHILKVHSNYENLSSNQNTSKLLMEPSMLKPLFPSTHKWSFKYNNQGHFRRNCEENQFFRHSKSNKGGQIQWESPDLATPFHLKSIDNSNISFAISEIVESASNISIPLETFSGEMKDYSVMPIRVDYGDKSIIFPMLKAKDGRIFDMFNNLFKNEQTAKEEPLAANNRILETVPCINIVMPTNNTNNASNNHTMTNVNTMENVNKIFSKPVQNNRGISHDLQNNQKMAGRVIRSSFKNYKQDSTEISTGYYNSPDMQNGPGQNCSFDYPQQQQRFHQQQQQRYLPSNLEMQQNSGRRNSSNSFSRRWSKKNVKMNHSNV